MELIFPNNNEEKLLAEARRLGHKEVIFCYDDPKDIPQNTYGKTALIVINRQRAAAWSKKADFLFGPAKREYFEDKRITGIISPGLEPKKDHTHFRRSLTQVEATLATQQQKRIYFLLSDLHDSKRVEELLGRWLQDFSLLKKYKTPFTVVSGAKNILGLRSKKDLESFAKIR